MSITHARVITDPVIDGIHAALDRLEATRPFKLPRTTEEPTETHPQPSHTSNLVESGVLAGCPGETNIVEESALTPSSCAIAAQAEGGEHSNNTSAAVVVGCAGEHPAGSAGEAGDSTRPWFDVESDSRIVQRNNVMVLLSPPEELDDVIASFCGAVVSDLAELPELEHATVYLCGDMSVAKRHAQKIDTAKRVFVVKQLAHGYEDDTEMTWPVVDVGRVPILVHGVGVYYRRFFNDADRSYFSRINSEHGFQELTESNKPGTAHRTGIYLTPVEQRGEETHFRVLRCSSNFTGPTGNFEKTDREIVGALNEEAASVFENNADLNHVLAQNYRNIPGNAGQKVKQIKARIKAHADKTKDMPANGLMAFCTFYDGMGRLQPLKDGFDCGHKGISGMTSLHFRLKHPNRPGCNLATEFKVRLYPNSVFFMPLSTNRLYTHEIVPGPLEASMLPTRLGYVVRCSSTEAVHSNNQTYLKLNGQLVPLEPPTPEGMADLRGVYAEENRSDQLIDYGLERGNFLFSMNHGDYTRPTLECPTDLFKSIEVDPGANVFDSMLSNVEFEDVIKGRQGTVLLQPAAQGAPIVRTTTKYTSPAQGFQEAHAGVARLIQEQAGVPHEFNNALVEVYSNAYCKMGFHSDQAQDLADGSFIALFSCYEHPEMNTAPRKLVVEAKDPTGGAFEVALTHNSVVVWSMETNRRFRHKIVLDVSSHPPENRWLGLTFRTSKTFVRFEGDRACLEDGTVLRLAEKEEAREFYKLRAAENREIEFEYPALSFTVSPSDMMPPDTSGAQAEISN